VEATRASADEKGPIEMVVGLIKELKAKLEGDEEMEQKIYNKFACWCETTSTRKAKGIEEAKKEIEKLGNKVLELKGEVATLAHEIAELTKDIAENEAAQEEATALRQKENSEYMAEKTELEQAINALERAIIVLGKGTKASLVQSQQQQVLADVRRAVQLMPSTNPLSPTKLSEVSAFLKDPSSLLQMSGKTEYNPASSTIIGILKDMYDTFSADLETQTEQEATGQKNYEDFMATKAKQLATLQATLAKKEARKAEVEKDLADTTQALEDTTAQLKEDTKFFDEMKANCKAKADEWNIRTSMRAEELEGINKALEVLTSDEARQIFSKAIKPGMEPTPESFLQLASDSGMSIPKAKAYDALKKAATKTHSLRLAALAATVRSAGAFKVVIDEIDKMIQVLKDEEAADIEQRDWCKEETFKKEQEKSRYEYKIEKTEAKIVKLTEKKEELEAAIIQTQKEIDMTHEEITEMEATRTEEHDAFLEAKDLDEKAIELLNTAIDHLSAFYKKNEIDMGEIQGSSKFLQQGPEFEVSEDQAPDATFSDAGHRKGQSKGIISILTMLVEDLTSEIKNGIAAEDKAQAEFEKAVHTAKELIASLEEKKVNLETEHAETVEKIAEQEAIQEETEGMLEAVKEQLADMKPNCDWLLGAFEKRREKRKIEMEGLNTAKAYLSGAQPGASLTQKSTSFDDEKFGTLKFSEVSFLQKRQ